MDRKTHSSHPNRSSRRRRAAAAVAAALGSAVIAAPALAATSTPADGSGNFAFQTVNNPRDLTFNQLLGINNYGLIAGYFGSGMAGHPNKGYTFNGSFQSENFPGSAQTQVTSLNNSGVTVGFWANKAGANFGFYTAGHRHFRIADYPTMNPAKTPIDQLLGVNDHDLAVGFYTTANGTNHGYSYNIRTHHYRPITVAGDTNVTATSINHPGDVAGFATNAGGAIEGFAKLADGRTVHLDVPGATTTQALGINDGDEVVGDYMVGTGSSATTAGFVWAPGFGFETINDPNGVGATTINGVNDRGTIVGFYTDSSGNTDGLVAKPQG